MVKLRQVEGCEYYPSREALPADAFSQLERLAFQFGSSYDSYLALEGGREYFWCGERRGAVAFARVGRQISVLGGFLAPNHERPSLLADFGRFVRLNRLRVLWFNVTDEEIGLFRQSGYQITKWGADTLVDLEAADFRGGQFDWLRRQENYCTRRGLRFREIPTNKSGAEYWEQIVPELESVSREHLANTGLGVEIRLLEGHFDAGQLGRRRLFVAESDTRVEAFVVCNPYANGSAWALELARRRKDAPRGVQPFLMVKILKRLRQEGAATASLCPVIGVGCNTPDEGDSWLVRATLRCWWKYLAGVVDTRGLYHFKSRFRPTYSTRYVAANPAVSLFSIISFFHLVGFTRPSLASVVGTALRKLRKRRARATLATPEGQPGPRSD